MTFLLADDFHTFGVWQDVEEEAVFERKVTNFS